MAVLFSSLHLIAWNYDFPSSVVKVLWRTFSLGATGSSLGPLILMLMSVAGILSRCGDWAQTAFFYTFSVLPIPIYCISRLGLIVLVFYCFKSMPREIYETVDWSIVFPHFS
jgi:hypothetical protein